jgi:2-haloacid dehalogenase
MAGALRDVVIFDLGGVLIDWDPRHLYRKLFARDDAAAATALGIHGIQFTTPETLRTELVGLGLLS